MSISRYRKWNFLCSELDYKRWNRNYVAKVPSLTKSFLHASAMLKHVIAIGWTSVRPSVRTSVRPSVTRWYCIKTAEHIVMLSSPHDSPFILVLCISWSSLREIPTGSLPAGPLNRGGVWKCRNFRPIYTRHHISLYLINRWKIYIAFYKHWILFLSMLHFKSNQIKYIWQHKKTTHWQHIYRDCPSGVPKEAKMYKICDTRTSRRMATANGTCASVSAISLRHILASPGSVMGKS